MTTDTELLDWLEEYTRENSNVNVMHGRDLISLDFPTIRGSGLRDALSQAKAMWSPQSERDKLLDEAIKSADSIPADGFGYMKRSADIKREIIAALRILKDKP